MPTCPKQNSEKKISPDTFIHLLTLQPRDGPSRLLVLQQIRIGALAPHLAIFLKVWENLKNRTCDYKLTV